MKAESRHRILLSAYACEPGRGSEPGVGWNWALSLVRLGHEVWVLTRANNRACIEAALRAGVNVDVSKLHFVYYDLPAWARWWKKGGRGVHLYYALWQRFVLGIAAQAHREHRFSVVHHITLGAWRQPSHLFKLGVPLIFGPVGGGESASWNLVRTLPALAQAGELMRLVVNWLSLLNPVLRKCLRQAVLVVAKTPQTADWVRRCGSPCITSLEIGVDQTIVQFGEQCEAPIRKGPLRCIYAGRLIGWKGVHLSIEAVAHARRAGADVSLTVVGSGPMRNALAGAVELNDVQGVVTFIPWLAQPTLFAEYRSHDILLFPSFHDSSGNVVLEAFAHGLPVLCFATGGPSVLVDETNGISVSPIGSAAEGFDPALRLAAQLIRLTADKLLQTRLASGARATASQMEWWAAAQRVYSAINVPDRSNCSADVSTTVRGLAEN